MLKTKQKINQGSEPAMSLESFLSSVKKAKQLEQERDEVKAAQQQQNCYRQEVQILKSLEGFKEINDVCQESFSNAKLSKEQQRIVNEFLALRQKSQKDTQYNPKSFLQARLLSVSQDLAYEELQEELMKISLPSKKQSIKNDQPKPQKKAIKKLAQEISRLQGMLDYLTLQERVDLYDRKIKAMAALEQLKQFDNNVNDITNQQAAETIYRLHNLTSFQAGGVFLDNLQTCMTELFRKIMPPIVFAFLDQVHHGNVPISAQSFLDNLEDLAEQFPVVVEYLVPINDSKGKSGYANSEYSNKVNLLALAIRRDQITLRAVLSLLAEGPQPLSQQDVFKALANETLYNFTRMLQTISNIEGIAQIKELFETEQYSRYRQYPVLFSKIDIDIKAGYIGEKFIFHIFAKSLELNNNYMFEHFWIDAFGADSKPAIGDKDVGLLIKAEVGKIINAHKNDFLLQAKAKNQLRQPLYFYVLLDFNQSTAIEECSARAILKAISSVLANFLFAYDDSKEAIDLAHKYIGSCSILGIAKILSDNWAMLDESTPSPSAVAIKFALDAFERSLESDIGKMLIVLTFRIYQHNKELLDKLCKHVESIEIKSVKIFSFIAIKAMSDSKGFVKQQVMESIDTVMQKYAANLISSLIHERYNSDPQDIAELSGEFLDAAIDLQYYHKQYCAAIEEKLAPVLRPTYTGAFKLQDLTLSVGKGAISAQIKIKNNLSVAINNKVDCVKNIANINLGIFADQYECSAENKSFPDNIKPKKVLASRIEDCKKLLAEQLENLGSELAPSLEILPEGFLELVLQLSGAGQFDGE